MYPVLDMDDFSQLGTYRFLKDVYLSTYEEPSFVHPKIKKFYEDPINKNYFIRFPFQCHIDIEKVKNIFEYFDFEISYSYDFKWEFIAKKKYLTPDGFIDTKLGIMNQLSHDGHYCLVIYIIYLHNKNCLKDVIDKIHYESKAHLLCSKICFKDIYYYGDC